MESGNGRRLRDSTRNFERAQQLNPDDWNYHRQDWSFGPNAGRKWLEKSQKSDRKDYPLDIKPDPKKKGGSPTPRAVRPATPASIGRASCLWRRGVRRDGRFRRAVLSGPARART